MTMTATFHSSDWPSRKKKLWRNWIFSLTRIVK